METGPTTTADEHVVYFYDTNADLAAVVADFVAEELRGGGAVVLVVSPAHATDIEGEVARLGIDTEAARAERRLVVRDAAATLELLMVDGEVEPDAFEHTIGSLVRPVCATAHVRVVGEMVGLLWSGGDVANAIALERLWGELHHELGFSLLCAYPSSDARTQWLPDVFDAVCAAHTGLHGGAPAMPDADAVRRLPASIRTPRAAREFTTATLEDWGLGHVADTAALVVTELTTNGVMHAGSDVSVALDRRGDVVRIGVGDRSGTPPEPRQPSRDGTGGHGLHLVAALTVAWGVVQADGGKVVWAELAIAHPQEL